MVGSDLPPRYRRQAPRGLLVGRAEQISGSRLPPCPISQTSRLLEGQVPQGPLASGGVSNTHLAFLGKRG